MRYLLDTDVCVDYLRGTPAVPERLHALSPRDIGVGPVVIAELRYGAERSRRPERNHRLLDDLLAELRRVPLDERAAEEYGRLRTELERSGKRIGPNDMLIAAQARALELTLVSADRALRRVPGLQLESWR